MTFKEQFCEEIDEAKEIGIREGEYNKSLDVARNALSMGLTVEQVIKLTGLSEEEIRNL